MVLLFFCEMPCIPSLAPKASSCTKEVQSCFVQDLIFPIKMENPALKILFFYFFFLHSVGLIATAATSLLCLKHDIMITVHLLWKPGTAEPTFT